MKFSEAVKLSEVIDARLFEGLPNLYEFTDQQLFDIQNINKWWNRGKMTTSAKKMYASHLLVEPLKIIDQAVTNMEK
jgi:hypothetical protein